MICIITANPIDLALKYYLLMEVEFLLSKGLWHDQDRHLGKDRGNHHTSNEELLLSSMDSHKASRDTKVLVLHEKVAVGRH